MLQVQSSTSVYVRRPGNPKKWQAEVLCVGHVCDLALLTVKDDAFWDAELMSLRFSDVPELQVRYLIPRLLLRERHCLRVICKGLYLQGLYQLLLGAL